MRFFSLLITFLIFSAVSNAEVILNPVGTFETGVFGQGAAEIVAYDTAAQRVFVINADASIVDVLDISDPSNPNKIFDINVTNDINPNGGINSVDVKNGLVAIAVENDNPTMDGFVAFYDTEGNFISFVNVGNLPDAVKFTEDGNKVVVANEGEQVGDGGDPELFVADPKGSISIIDVSSGAAAATAVTLDFTGFDGREAEFAAKGVKLQPGNLMSTELEPEFPAISPDGKKAFVTLQEANAFAVVDLTAPPKIIDIVPLGFKNHSKGQPQLSLFPFNGLPNLGHDANGLSIKLGGFSGLAFEGQKNKNVLSFITVPDRGPNGGEVVGGARTFNLPNYQARIVRFDINTKSNNAHVINGQTIFLTRAGGIPITGLPNVPGFDEVPVDAAGNSLSYDPFGADLEGIVRDPKDNTFWMVDEYRPSIYHFDNKGKLITRLVPEGTTELSPAAVQAAAHRVAEAEIVPGFYGDETLPEVYNTHRTNRGFEAVALDPENRILYAFIQSPLENPDRDQRTSSILRILGVDINSASDTFLQPVKEYVYLLERPAHALDTGVDKIGDAVYAGNGKFLVIERDSSLDPKGKKYVFEVHLKGATNIRELAIADETDPADSDMVNTLEELTPDELADQGIIPVSKIKVLNLPSIGYTQSDKPEGIALLPDGKIAVLNDNDFGIEEAEGLIPVVGLISFNDGNKLDASNSDGGINIRNWPVFGMYQPDSIDAYDVNGMTFYVTANEGDSRVFDFFSEERRIGAVSVVLDPDVFPPALNLKNNANLGRLNITNILGDTDGDGDFDKLFAYGARSFSIWDTFGNLVYDSSDDLEEITAALLPDDFNSTNNANSSFDSRSDDKGPEPEGVVTGVVNGKTFAFIGLERIGGVMVYDITDPYNPVFVDYFNNRNFTVQAQNPDNSTNSAVGDLGPEGLEFVPASDSPNGIPLLIVGNEVSGTTTVYEVNAE